MVNFFFVVVFFCLFKNEPQLCEHNNYEARYNIYRHLLAFKAMLELEKNGGGLK